MRIDIIYLIYITVCSTEIEAIIHHAVPRRNGTLKVKSIGRYGRRIIVGHVKKRRNAAASRSPALRIYICCRSIAGLAEVNMGVYYAGHDIAAREINHFSSGGGSRLLHSCYPGVFDYQIGLFLSIAIDNSAAFENSSHPLLPL